MAVPIASAIANKDNALLVLSSFTAFVSNERNATAAIFVIAPITVPVIIIITNR